MEKELLDKLKSKMRRGDRQLIAQKAKCSIFSVDLALKDELHGEVGERVIATLVNILEKREQEKKETENRIKKLVSKTV